VVLESKLYVYNFQHLELADSYLTCANPQGLVSLSTDEKNCVLAFPDETVGCVKIILFNNDKKVVQARCHTASIAAMKLSQDGTLLATASNKGTLIRVFDSFTGQQVSEYRRGADQAVITDISIDPLNEYVCSASDKGTVHIFKIEKGAQDADVQNKKSALSALGGAIGYFGSKWSFSQFRVKDSHCKCAIIDKRIFAISVQGNYFMGELQQSGDVKIDKQADLLEESNRANGQE